MYFVKLSVVILLIIYIFLSNWEKQCAIYFNKGRQVTCRDEHVLDVNDKYVWHIQLINNSACLDEALSPW